MKDEWMTKQIGKLVYKLNVNGFEFQKFHLDWDNFIKDRSKKPFFVYTKISTNYVEFWQCLEKANFMLIDTNLQFELKGMISNKKSLKKDVKIIIANESHKESASLIAYNNFIYSRFHLDPLIENKIANQLKLNWVKNYFLGKRGDAMVIALINGQPVGFLQLIINKQELIIDLIGVDKEAQGNGVASGMIQFITENFRYRFIRVGTQVSNIPSIKLYQKLGFVLTGSDYVFHYHS